MTVSAFAPATITAAKMPDRHAVNPPMVGADTGPSSATSPGPFTICAAIVCCDAAVG
ncbi:MAG: hypothetical protein WAL97_06460 [Halobacteriota archaeon]